MSERRCKWCNEPIGAWARRNRLYCDRSCMDSWRYENIYKPFYDERYKRQKREWERSDSGKRAGVPIREWLKLPKDWR